MLGIQPYRRVPKQEASKHMAGVETWGCPNIQVCIQTYGASRHTGLHPNIWGHSNIQGMHPNVWWHLNIQGGIQTYWGTSFVKS